MYCIVLNSDLYLYHKKDIAMFFSVLFAVLMSTILAFSPGHSAKKEALPKAEPISFSVLEMRIVMTNVAEADTLSEQRLSETLRSL